MTLPTTEVLIFPATEAYQNDTSIIFPAVDIVLSAPGAQSVFYGKEIKDSNKNNGYVFIDWDSVKHHHDTSNSALFPHLLEALKPVFGGPFKMHLVPFPSELKALQQPITEVSCFTLKSPEYQKQFVAILDEAVATHNGLLVYGQATNDKNVYVVLYGQSESGKTYLNEERVRLLQSLADQVVGHTSLTKYTK